MADSSPKADLEKAIWDALRLMGFGTVWTADAVPTVDAILAAADVYAVQRAAQSEVSDEDRIRDAMAEAREHPGRIVTR